MPATPTETELLEHEVRIAAEPETVFGFFTDPLKMVEWMGAEATLDPQPGGVFRVGFRVSDAVADFVGGPGTNAVLGEFVALEPHRRIVFTWGYERRLFNMPPQATEVVVTLTPDGADTIVRLAHRRLPAAGTAFHRAGWEHYLPRLATVAAGGDPGDDAWQVTG
jgi:uncharacterized protein YndB with AHSA1/START domain